MADEWTDIPIQDEWTDLNIDTMPIGTGPVAKDFVKGSLVGLGEGAIAGAGLPGDVEHLGREGLRWGLDKAGVPHMEKGIGPFEGGNLLPTSRSIKHGVEKVTGDFYKPQFLPGKYGRTTGQFLGNPATYLGPGSIPAKMGQATMAGLGSEAAGQAGEALAGAPGEAIGRVAGALGPGLASTRMGLSRPRAGSEQVLESGRKQYEAMNNLPMAWEKRVAEDLSSTIKTELNLISSPSNAPETYKAIDAWQKWILGTRKQPGTGRLTPHEFNEFYKSLSDIAAKGGKDGHAARRAQEEINNYLIAPAPGDMIRGQSFIPHLSKLAHDARADWKGGSQMELIEDARRHALRQAASTGTGANIQNKGEQAVVRILGSEGKSRGMSPEVLASLEKVATKGPYLTTQRKLGKLAPTSPISAGATKWLGRGLIGAPMAGGAAYGYNTGDLTGAAALAGIGIGAKKLGERGTERRTNQALETILKETPYGKSLPPPTTQTWCPAPDLHPRHRLSNT